MTEKKKAKMSPSLLLRVAKKIFVLRSAFYSRKEKSDENCWAISQVDEEEEENGKIFEGLIEFPMVLNARGQFCAGRRNIKVPFKIA